MLEVEVKYRADDWPRLVVALEALGATADPPRQESDHYFNAPDRDFAETDEAVRLRRTGDANELTYKGPKVDADTKTRREIEVPLADGTNAADAASAFLTSLRYRPTAVVSKTRQVYHLDRDGFAVEVCLDDVAEVGRFVELEIVAEDARYAAAKAALLGVASELGLGELERKSYLRLLLEARGFL